MPFRRGAVMSRLSLVLRGLIWASALMLCRSAAADQVVPPPPLQVPPQSPVADLQPSSSVLGSTMHRPGAIASPPRLAYPLPEPAAELDPYGWRWSDSRQLWRIHAGHDLIVPQGTPVLAMAAGRVVLMGFVEGYGLTVLLDHGDGWQSLYAHLLDAGVRERDVVQAGMPIGRVGQSGRATTPHLHVELRHRLAGEAQVVAVDPASQLAEALQGLLLQQAQGVSLASP